MSRSRSSRTRCARLSPRRCRRGRGAGGLTLSVRRDRAGRRKCVSRKRPCARQSGPLPSRHRRRAGRKLLPQQGERGRLRALAAQGRRGRAKAGLVARHQHAAHGRIGKALDGPARRPAPPDRARARTDLGPRTEKRQDIVERLAHADRGRGDHERGTKAEPRKRTADERGGGTSAGVQRTVVIVERGSSQLDSHGAAERACAS